MLKKIITSIIAIALLSSMAIQHSPQAAEEHFGVNDIIFIQNNNTIVEHGFNIDQIGYEAIKLHLLIADKDIQNLTYQGKILKTIQTLKELTEKDIIEMLDMAKDKKASLYTYLTNCFEELQKGESILTYMRQEMDMIKSDMEACFTDKALSDKEYFNAIEKYDQNMMETALADSLRYENCATKNRIAYNAKVILARKLTFYLGILQKKYDLLEEKQEILAENFKVFRDNILPDLNQIDDLLQQYNF